MKSRKAVEFTPFMGLKDAVTYTGLSYNYLRTGCANGTVPHIRIGRKIMVNVIRLMEQLDALPSDKITTVAK